MFPFTRVPFWAPIFDPQPFEAQNNNLRSRKPPKGVPSANLQGSSCRGPKTSGRLKAILHTCCKGKPPKGAQKGAQDGEKTDTPSHPHQCHKIKDSEAQPRRALARPPVSTAKPRGVTASRRSKARKEGKYGCGSKIGTRFGNPGK